MSQKISSHDDHLKPMDNAWQPFLALSSWTPHVTHSQLALSMNKQQHFNCLIVLFNSILSLNLFLKGEQQNLGSLKYSINYKNKPLKHYAGINFAKPILVLVNTCMYSKIY